MTQYWYCLNNWNYFEIKVALDEFDYFELNIDFALGISIIAIIDWKLTSFSFKDFMSPIKSSYNFGAFDSAYSSKVVKVVDIKCLFTSSM